MNTYSREDILSSFRNPRYESLNETRWNHFLAMGIPIKNQLIFEPGAGVGDQTEWLLKQDPMFIWVNEGREGNAEIIRDRFVGNFRVEVFCGDLESCLAFPEYDFYADLIFCYGVYYHLREDEQFTIMRQLSKLGETIAFDYLAGEDGEVSYGYDNPSTSISQYARRPRRETMTAALKTCWEFVYDPKEPLAWVDPQAYEDRVVAVASHVELNNPSLIQK